MLDSSWLNAALFLLPALVTALVLCGHAWSEYPTCREGLRALWPHALPALLAASAMLYLSSLVLTAAVVALLFRA